MKTAPVVLRFGRNELDLHRYELRRQGKRLPLSHSLLELLHLLVERRGGLVTREEIAANLWTDPQMVDVVQGINTAITRLRGVLNDDPSKPRFIETVVGKGYRFVAEVTEESDPAPAFPTSEQALPETPLAIPPHPPPSLIAPPLRPAAEKVTLEESRRSLLLKWLAPLSALALALALMAFVAIEVIRNSSVPAQNGRSASNESLNFQQVTMNDSENSVTAGAISPDGRLLAYADSAGISLRVIESGSEQVLSSPQRFQVDRISWFPDDLRLAISGYTRDSLKPQIWIVFVTGAPARLLLDQARNGVPSPDGNAFSYTTGHDAVIWAGGATGEDSRSITVGRSGETFPYVFWSADSKRLVYQRQKYLPVQSRLASPKEDVETNYSSDYESVELASRKIVASVPNVRFSSACVLPDGRMLYLQSGLNAKRDAFALWQVQTDPATGIIRAQPQMLFNFERRASAISASGNGKEIATVLEKDRSSVYVADLHRPGLSLQNVRRLTHVLQSDFPHAWTPASDAVIFESDRGGKFQIYKQRLDSRTAETLASASQGAILPSAVPGGKWILFAGRNTPLNIAFAHTSFSLFRVPINGGNVELVRIDGPLDEFQCSLSESHPCVLRETIGHQQFVYYSLNPVTGKGAELGHTAWAPTVLGNWGLSPDGLTVALPVRNPHERTIRLVPLAGSARNAQEHEISFTATGDLMGITWASHGKGFYAEMKTDVGCNLLYVDMQGGATVLRQTSNGVWGVPSPDGTKLAFVDQTVDSNVWLSRGK